MDASIPAGLGGGVPPRSGISRRSELWYSTTCLEARLAQVASTAGSALWYRARSSHPSGTKTPLSRNATPPVASRTPTARRAEAEGSGRAGRRSGGEPLDAFVRRQGVDHLGTGHGCAAQGLDAPLGVGQARGGAIT